MKNEMMTISQVADYVQLSIKTVRRMVSDKKIPAYKVGERSWRIMRDDIDRYIKSHGNQINDIAATKRYSVIDLFCGAGGLHVGFEEVGYDIRLCIDNDPLVERTHKRNFPQIPLINKDISKISMKDIKNVCGANVDIIIGGPPCQGFSTIGKRVSSDPKKRNKVDSRNELVYAYARIVSAIKPKFIVMENVPYGKNYIRDVMKRRKKWKEDSLIPCSDFQNRDKAFHNLIYFSHKRSSQAMMSPSRSQDICAGS